ncbi:Tetrapyrrole-binding protein [Thalictrum thalictroides]|uniref:Tetrapyrrole-binding protein n=1 Tax=Thalictrum thalictroides TaxID=46969 RepID=A0A7J6X2G0_THATH|nr:Tetrapyrrole-binding protein [Thalictrum thalictroides]
MATTYLQSLHHTQLKRHNLSDIQSSSFLPSSLFLKPNFTSPSLSQKLSYTHFTLYSTTSSGAATTNTTITTTTPSSPTLTFDLLKQYLASKDFRQADEETRRLIIVLAGEAAEKRGYVFFSEVQFISESDLQTIDILWRQSSDNKFGYSVQKRIYEKEKEDFSRFFEKVGWMKKLDTEIEQYNYRAFPNEFIWELTDDTPEGHLPLTNALRGTQLLKSILYHPAFQNALEDEDEKEEDGAKNQGNEVEESKKSSKPFKGLFKTDYSF